MRPEHIEMLAHLREEDEAIFIGFTAILELLERMEERLERLEHQIAHNQENTMATIAELETAIDNVTTAVSTVGTDVTTVLGLLTDAQTNGAAIPQDAIDKLNAISANLATVDASLKAVEPPPAPVA